MVSDIEITLYSKDLLSVAQVAKALGKPRLTIYRWVAAKKIASIKLGGVLFIPKSEVERLKGKG